MNVAKELQFFYTYLKENYDIDFSNLIIKESMTILDKLKEENKNEIKEVKVHTFKKIYPAISVYKSLLKFGIEKDEAIDFIDKSLCKNSVKKAKSLQSLMKIPQAYKLMPKMFKKVTIKSFGEKAGFKFKFYDKDKNEVKFDMTNCLYYNTCKRYDAEEICKGFCHTDDVCNEHMHKYLKWNRTQTIGEGGEVCDFNLYIIDKDGNKKESK